MTETVTSTVWSWGGWTTALPPSLLLILWIGLLAGGFFFILKSYRKNLQQAPPFHAMGLTVLRSLFWFLLLLCLAGPSQVKRTHLKSPPQSPLAVVLDCSGSMQQPDSQGLTRLNASLAQWNQISPQAEKSFQTIQYFTLTDTLSPLKKIQDYSKTAPDSTTTPLFQSLEQLIRNAPLRSYGGILCLTDGRDTTGVSTEGLVKASLQSSIPLHFIASNNRLRPPNRTAIREIQIPEQALARTRVKVRALVELTTSSELSIPISVERDGIPVSSGVLTAPPGCNILPWETDVTVESAGVSFIEFHLGEGENLLRSGSQITVRENRENHLLYYMGVLDWGWRFISKSMENAMGFHFTVLPHPFLRLTPSTPNPSNPQELPSNAVSLESYNLIVLAQAFADQLTPKQQEALVTYVKQGGSLLFLIPGSEASRAFAGTPLEEMLPVYFEPAITELNKDDAAKRFQEMMRQQRGGSHLQKEDIFSKQEESKTTSAPLFSWTLTEAGIPLQRLLTIPRSPTEPEKLSEIIPCFADYVPVQGVKPGASILAVHPAEKDSSGKPRILLARQRFGKGYSTVLATDSLWRWKLSLPSESTDPSIFWHQFFLWASGDGPRGLRFEKKNPDPISTGDEPSLLLSGATPMNPPPKVTVRAPSGKEAALEIKPSDQPGFFQISFKPDAIGYWMFQATDGNGQKARLSLTIGEPIARHEFSRLPPDLALLNQLAQRTGGELVSHTAPASWQSSEATARTHPLSEQHHPLWNHPLLFTLLLLLFCSELLWRRKIGLL